MRLGLRLRRAVVAIVEPGQDLPGLHDFIVRHWDGGDGGGDLRADRAGPRVDEGVVGVFEMTGVQPPRDAGRSRGESGNNDQARQELVPSDPGFGAALGRGFAVLLLIDDAWRGVDTRSLAALANVRPGRVSMTLGRLRFRLALGGRELFILGWCHRGAP